jgi:solute carrier family 25 (mitochondrial phosphate transporter), member 23/24/25/41
MAALSSDNNTSHITFGNFRDFLILLPRKASTAEIYRYYKLKRYLGEDGRGSARVNMEGWCFLTIPSASRQLTTCPAGDVSLSAEDKPPPATKRDGGLHLPQNTRTYDWDEEEEPFDDPEADAATSHVLEGHTALKFLFAGGVAGAGMIADNPGDHFINVS